MTLDSTLLRGRRRTVASRPRNVAQADGAAMERRTVINVASPSPPSMDISNDTGTGSQPPTYYPRRPQEAAKTAGTHHQHRVMVVRARNRRRIRIYMVTEYKNWARSTVSRQVRPVSAPRVEGSVEKAVSSLRRLAKEDRTVTSSRSPAGSLLTVRQSAGGAASSSRRTAYPLVCRRSAVRFTVR